MLPVQKINADVIFTVINLPVSSFSDLYQLIFLHRAEITEAAVCLEHKQCALKDAPQ